MPDSRLSLEAALDDVEHEWLTHSLRDWAFEARAEKRNVDVSLTPDEADFIAKVLGKHFEVSA